MAVVVVVACRAVGGGGGDDGELAACRVVAVVARWWKWRWVAGDGVSVAGWLLPVGIANYHLLSGEEVGGGGRMAGVGEVGSETPDDVDTPQHLHGRQPSPPHPSSYVGDISLPCPPHNFPLAPSVSLALASSRDSHPICRIPRPPCRGLACTTSRTCCMTKTTILPRSVCLPRLCSICRSPCPNIFLPLCRNISRHLYRNISQPPCHNISRPPCRTASARNVCRSVESTKDQHEKRTAHLQNFTYNYGYYIGAITSMYCLQLASHAFNSVR